MFQLFILFLALSPHSSSADIEPSVCPAGQHWVNPHRRRAHCRADGTYVSATRVTGHCKDNPSSYESWSKRLKDDRPPNWQIKQDRRKKWTVEEQERVLEALSELPEILVKQSISGIHRMRQSQIYLKNPAAGRPKRIVLYDRAFSSSENLARILGHELAHEWYRSMPRSEKVEYLKISSWLPIQKPGKPQLMLIPNREDYVTSDGKESPDEDFSNNIEYFIFDVKKLKQMNPEIHEWIRKRYGDKLNLRKGGSQ